MAFMEDAKRSHGVGVGVVVLVNEGVVGERVVSIKGGYRGGWGIIC